MANASSSAPNYDPVLWNDTPLVSYTTNCYAYVCDDPFDHFYSENTPQPGEKAGATKVAATIQEVRREALRDGLMPAMIDTNGTPQPKDGYYLAAFSHNPDRGFHWYRQDKNGTWSHKEGRMKVTNLDADKKPITDPRTANKGIYEKFGGYFYVPEGGIRVGAKARHFPHATKEGDQCEHLRKTAHLTNKKSRLLDESNVFDKEIIKSLKRTKDLDEMQQAIKDNLKLLAQKGRK